MAKIRSLRVTLLLAMMPIMLIVSGCGDTTATMGASYQPPFAPVIFTIDSSGTISVQGNLSIETSIGRFALEANVADTLQPEDNALLLVIRHKQNGKVVDDVYKIQTGQDEVRVTTNGTTTVDLTQHKVFIDASKGSIQTIELKDSNSKSTTISSQQKLTTVTVDATQGWQNSGVLINAGNSMSIRYISGQWTSQSGVFAPFDGKGQPNGYICANIEPASQCVEAVPDAIKGSLVGKIGTESFEVSDYLKFNPTQGGVLYLRMNDGDDGLYDNQGSITVQIEAS